MNSAALQFQRIQAIVFGLVLVAVSFTAGGCRICADCEDLDYPAYGGAWQRTLRQSGRVGSVFDPGGAKAASLVDRSTPEDPDQIERRRQEEDGDNQDDPDPNEEDGGDDDSDDSKSESMKEREKKLREKELDDIESEDESDLRKKKLEDIEVRIIPGGGPRMITTK